VVLPDLAIEILTMIFVVSQCTYRCAVLPDRTSPLTEPVQLVSQCTYRCVVLPDFGEDTNLSAPWPRSQCTYRCAVLPDLSSSSRGTPLSACLNAPTGARCSLTLFSHSQGCMKLVSMHLQVRGAP